jgi:hypothetical protein
LFRRDARYLGARLLRAVAAARVYVTMDTWESREAHATEYAELDEKCAVLTESERQLGEYEK